MDNLGLNLIVETVYPVPAHWYRSMLNGFIGQASQPLACSFVTIKISIEQELIHHGIECTIKFFNKEQNDVLQFTDGLRGISIKDIPANAIENIALD